MSQGTTQPQRRRLGRSPSPSPSPPRIIEKTRATNTPTPSEKILARNASKLALKEALSRLKGKLSYSLFLTSGFSNKVLQWGCLCPFTDVQCVCYKIPRKKELIANPKNICTYKTINVPEKFLIAIDAKIVKSDENT